MDKRDIPGTPEYARKLAWKREWRRQNADKIRARKTEYEHAHPEKKAAWQRRYHLKKKYGVTPEQYDAWLAEHPGCSICGAEESLHIDHDHATDSLRGLLCGKCNRGLGMFDDSIQRLRDAAQYLETHY